VLLSGLLATNKIYDGTAADTLNISNVGIFGVISGDTSDVTLNTSGGIGTFASTNAGNTIAVGVSGFTLTGSKANDYQLIAPTNLTADITPKMLTISGVTASDKVYDGTTTDTLNVGSASLNGVVGSDNVSLLTGSAAGTFSQSDVGNNLAVTANGLTLTGTAAGNYTLAEPTGLTADITPRPLTVTFNGNPAKIYDGTDAATLTQSDFSITGFASGTQSATVSQSPAIYASSNAGTNIGVTATLQPSDFSVGSGTSLSNYSFNSSVTGLGTIDPAPLVLFRSSTTPPRSTTATPDATLGAGNYSLSGLIGSDSISLVNTPTTGTSTLRPVPGIEGVTATVNGSNYGATRQHVVVELRATDAGQRLWHHYPGGAWHQHHGQPQSAGYAGVRRHQHLPAQCHHWHRHHLYAGFLADRFPEQRQRLRQRQHHRFFRQQECQ
jgi:hypothetical protein